MVPQVTRSGRVHEAVGAAGHAHDDWQAHGKHCLGDSIMYVSYVHGCSRASAVDTQ